MRRALIAMAVLPLWAAGIGVPVGLGTVAASAAEVDSAPVACRLGADRDVVVDCLKSSWPVLVKRYAQAVRARGRAWREPALKVFDRIPPKNPCHSPADGGAPSSFYCPNNQTVYMMVGIADASTTKYVRLAGQAKGVLKADAIRAEVSLHKLRQGYPAQAQVTALAHELAHHALELSRVQRWYDKRTVKYELGSQRYDQFGYAPETASDCLSGAVLRKAKQEREMRMDQFDLWGSRTEYAANDPFESAIPLKSPFVYGNGYAGSVYRGYGGAYWRIKSFNVGFAKAGRKGDPIAFCARTASKFKQIKAPKFK